jgi:type I phosphodiesterase/nucleotide pyrophosphatase
VSRPSPHEPHTDAPSDDPSPGDDARHITRRAFLAGAAATTGAVWLNLGRPASASEPGKDPGPTGACRLPHEVLQRIWRGYRSDRSGQIIVVPHGANFMAGGISHSTPFPYTQDVPVFWYGPGFIRQQGSVSRHVTSADIAPTLAQLLGFDWQAIPDGTPMIEALEPSRTGKPKLVVVMVYDAGGRYVLDLWPKSWPFLTGMIPQGTWFDAATVGSNPSNTAPIHATIGTGSFPMHHGVVDNTIRYPDGTLHDPYTHGPDHALKTRAFGEDYAAAVGSDAIVGLSGTVPWHLGMIGRGSDGGGPQTIAVLKETLGDAGNTAPRWGLPSMVAPYYRVPDYVNELTPITDYWWVAETIDGGPKGSGKWRTHDIASLQGGFHTPARIPYQTNLIEEMIKREGFGTHAETDVLFCNHKLIDEVGHMFFASAIEMRDAILVQDRYLRKFTTFLDRQVGKGEWVLVLTADHGHTAAPAVSGSFGIDERKLRSLVARRFDKQSNGTALIDLVRPIWLNMNRSEMAANHVATEDISRFFSTFTKGQTYLPKAPVTGVAAKQKVFDAVFAGSLLTHLPCLPEAHQ